MTISIVGVGTENGISYVDVRYSGTASGTTNSSIQFEQNTAIPATNGQTWAVSSYLKVVGGSTSGISLIRLGWEERSTIFLTTQVSPTITPKASGSLTAARVSFSATNGNASTTFIKPVMLFTPVSGAIIDITLRIGLPQLELGAFATSVIPTTTAATTRAADVATITGMNFSSWYNATEGTVYWQGSVIGVLQVTQYFWQFDDGSSNNRFYSRKESGASVFRVFGASGGTSDVSINPAPSITITAGVTYSEASAYATNNFAASVSGLATVSDTSGNVATGINILRLGAGENGTPSFNGYIRRIAYYPTRLSNAALQALTA
jgi:hypothetical protein